MFGEQDRRGFLWNSGIVSVTLAGAALDEHIKQFRRFDKDYFDKIANPDRTAREDLHATEEQMERWANDFDSWDVCDQCCMNLFKKTKFAYQKAVEWSSNDKEFVKRAAFVLMARLAVSHKQATDGQFEPFFPIIKREAGDNRNFVRKAVNWALRQIGKRNLNLNRRAIQTAEDIQRMDSRSARWIASDALRELTSQAVQQRLRG